MRKIKVFSASVGKRFGEVPENFGDNLMHYLLRDLYGLEVEYVSHSDAELLGVGSVLDAYFRKRRGQPVGWLRKRPWRTLNVWGSGFMASTSDAAWPQTLAFAAVRGPLSRSRIGGSPDSVALGDPGLLLPQIWPSSSVKTSKVLVAPHFATHETFLKQYAERLPKHWEVLDLLSEPQQLANKIAQADFVISSSLHGLIVADAYNVPSCWMKPHARIKGDGFKFDDYAAQRGKPLSGPIDFEDVLYGNISFDAAEYAPAPPSQVDISRLIDSFPLK